MILDLVIQFFYHGDEIYFDTIEGACEFIDEILN